ncbi:MAG: glycerate kinase type-2 family protein, partial [Solirubrobacterales bacterium]
PKIVNANQLASHGSKALRSAALRVAAAGLAGCDVGRATEETVSTSDRGVSIGGREYPVGPDARVVVLGSGKATLSIAAALERRLGDRLDGGIVAVRAGEEGPPLRRVEVLVADHPLPSKRSIAAAQRLVESADGLGPADLVLASFTGGSSALACLPPAGVSIAEKRGLHQLLLASGAPIAHVNAVRKHVSAFKGGRLAARIAPARIVNLTASDVAGDVLDAITDPTVVDTSTADDAITVLRDRGLWDEVPESVRVHLSTPEARSPDLDGALIETVLLATGAGACDAMVLEAKAAGLRAHIVSTTLEGEAREVGRVLTNVAGESSMRGTPFAPPCLLVGCGGEATVSLGDDGSFGAGGPNQEAALAAALALGDGARVAAAFVDTDGSDGGTDAAGAIVDGDTLSRARDAGVDIRNSLTGHRSREALERLDDLVLTGPTGTNVNDLFVLAVGSAEA